MSDLKGVEISDVLGMSEPLTKLLETVSCGIGKLYEPTHIRRIAKAKADEIKIISDAVTENLNLPVNYQNGFVGINSTDANALVQRAQNRFLFQQIKKQQNIESVVSCAYSALEGEEEVSKEPVDADWISSFFDFIANVSNEQMQKLWGKLLAGEVIRPGTYSVRTLDLLRKLTQKEAELFANLSPYILQCMGDECGTFRDFFIFVDSSEEKIMEKYGYSAPQIVILTEAGLISSNGTVSVGLKVKPGNSILFEGKNRIIEIKNNNEHDVLVAHQAHILTESGKELFSIIASTNQEIPSDEYYEDCAKLITEHNWLLSDAEGKLLDSRINEI